MSYICIFDLETTGKSPAKDHIVQICVRKVHPFSQRVLESFTTFVRSPTPIPYEASKANHITEQDLVHADKFADIAPNVFRIMHKTRWCGHNILAFDIPLLLREFSLANITPPTCDGVIDTLVIARGLRVSDRPFAASNSLENLARYFGLLKYNEKQTHQADDDVELTHQILQRLSTAAYIEHHLARLHVTTAPESNNNTDQPHPLLQLLKPAAAAKDGAQETKDPSDALRAAIEAQLSFRDNPTLCGMKTLAGNRCRFPATEHKICHKHMSKISSDLLKKSMSQSPPLSMPPEGFR